MQFESDEEVCLFAYSKLTLTQTFKFPLRRPTPSFFRCSNLGGRWRPVWRSARWTLRWRQWRRGGRFGLHSVSKCKWNIWTIFKLNFVTFCTKHFPVLNFYVQLFFHLSLVQQEMWWRWRRKIYILETLMLSGSSVSLVVSMTMPSCLKRKLTKSWKSWRYIWLIFFDTRSSSFLTPAHPSFCLYCTDGERWQRMWEPAGVTARLQHLRLHQNPPSAPSNE